MRSERGRLIDVVETIEKMKRYTTRGKGAFDCGELTRR